MDIDALCVVAQRSRLALRRPRENRFDMVRQDAGAWYSEEGSRVEVPVNMIGAYKSIVGRKLVANNPRALLTTPKKQFKAVTEAMGNWANHQIVRINLVETLQRSVYDSLFSIGIIKVALADVGQAAAMGWRIAGGEPYAETVDLDDFVFDVHARRFDHAAFMGNRYRIPLAAARKMFGKARAINLTISTDQIYNLEGDEKISLIGRTTLAGDEELEPMVELWEFFLPREKMLVTLHEDQLTGAGMIAEMGKGKALAMKRWIGPDTGPYHILGQGYLPGNPMPQAPLQSLFGLHLAINRAYRKIIDQVDRQKETVFVAGGADSDGKRLIDTNDGEVVRVDNPDRMKALTWGGPNQGNFQAMNAFIDRFSWLSGNLDIMGGLSPQAKTATQDELLNQNSSSLVADMQARVVAHAAEVVRSLCWFWYHHPTAVMQTTYNQPGVPSVTAERYIHPNGQGLYRMPNGRPGRRLSRDHRFEEMDIAIDPYSLQYQSPQQRMQALDQVVTQILAPMMPFLQQQGSGIDIMAYLALKAKLGDMPDLMTIMKAVPPPPQVEGGMGGAPQDQGQPAAPPMPQNTSREYVRRSVGGATQNGKQMEAGNQMGAPGPSVNGVKTL